MPNTRTFHSSGFRQGFPYSLALSDISSFDHWVTLGGYSKTSADAGASVTQKQINLSLDNAAKLFWNSYRFNIDVRVQGIGTGSSEPYTNTFLKTPIDNRLLDFGEESEPYQRVVAQANQGLASFSIGERINESSSSDGYDVNIDLAISIHKYYNGDVEDEDNFIGYGLGEIMFNAELETSGGFIRSIYRLDSVTPEEVGALPELNKEIGYTTVSGIPFVYGIGATAVASPPPDDPDDPPNAEAEFNFNADGISVNHSFFGTSTRCVTPSFEFYTYEETGS